MPSRLPVSIVLLLLAGCLGGSSPSERPGPDPEGFRSFAASLPDTQAPWGFGLQYVLDAVKGGNVTAAYAGAESPGQDQAAWACGFLTLRESHNGTLGPAFGRSLSYSRGHALLVAHGDRPFSANHSGAEENLFLAVNETTEGRLRVTTGQQVVVESAYLASSGAQPPPIRAALNLTTDGLLRLNRTVPFWFRCGANLEAFKGTFTAEGFSAGAVAVKEATAEIQAPVPTRAFFATYLDGRFLASSCSTALLHDGATVAESGPRANSECVVRGDLQAGRVGLRIMDSFMVGPRFYYSLREEPAGFTR